MCVDLLDWLKNRELNGTAHGATQRYNDLTQEQFLHNEHALRVIATEFKDGASEAPTPLPPEHTGPRLEDELKPNKYSKKVIKMMKSPFISLLFEELAGAGVTAYGGYDLKRNMTFANTDRDDQRRWGGQVRTEVADHVQQLQQDLRDLGFLLVGNPDGVLGRKTEWAVREFQIYAKMEYVAKEDTSGAQVYLDRLYLELEIFSGIQDLFQALLMQRHVPQFNTGKHKGGDVLSLLELIIVQVLMFSMRISGYTMRFKMSNIVCMHGTFLVTMISLLQEMQIIY